MTPWLILKRELRDLLSLWLVPGLAAFLPWRWCVHLYWWLAGTGLLLREEVSGSRGGRRMLGLPPDDPAFDRRFRFGFLLEHADLFRALGRGWRGLAATMPVVRDAASPPAGGLCFFYSFNQGLPAMAALRAAGYKVWMVYRSLPGRPPGAGWLRYAYMRLRVRMVTVVSGNPGIATGGARERIATAVAAGGLVFLAADSPPRPGTGVVPMRFPDGRQGWWRSGGPRLALELTGERYSVRVRIDWKARERSAQLRLLPPTEDLRELVTQLNLEFCENFAEQPELWFHWPGPQGFFQFPEGARPDL